MPSSGCGRARRANAGWRRWRGCRDCASQPARLQYLRALSLSPEQGQGPMVIHDNADPSSTDHRASASGSCWPCRWSGQGQPRRQCDLCPHWRICRSASPSSPRCPWRLRPGSDMERRFAPVAERVFGGYVALDYVRAAPARCRPTSRCTSSSMLAAAGWRRWRAAGLHSANYTHVGRYLLDRASTSRPSRASWRALQPQLQSRSHARPAEGARRRRRLRLRRRDQRQPAVHGRRGGDRRRRLRPPARRARGLVHAVRAAQGAAGSVRLRHGLPRRAPGARRGHPADRHRLCGRRRDPCALPAPARQCAVPRGRRRADAGAGHRAARGRAIRHWPVRLQRDVRRWFRT